MIFESSAAEATRRLRDSGVTVYETTTVSLNPFSTAKLGYGICVDSEDIFIKSGVDADNIAHLVIDL